MSEKVLRVGLDASMLSDQRTGIGNYVFQLLRELKASAPDNNLSLYLYSHRSIAPDCRFLGACTEHVGAWLRKGPLWLSTALPPLLVRDSIDVFWGANGYLPVQAHRSWGTVVTIYDLVYHYAGQTMPLHSRWARKLLQPHAAKHATAIVTISQATAAEIRDHYHREVDSIIPPGMDPVFTKASFQKISDVSEKYELPPKYLFTLGTLEPRKNFLALLDAYAQVRDSHPDTCPPLVIAGARGWLDSNLQKRLGQMIGDGGVRWLGFVPQQDMPALYGASDLFLFFPLYEGYGMPVREALLCGASVLCADLPALREAGESHARYAGTSTEAIRNALTQHLTQALSLAPRHPTMLRDHATDKENVARFAQVLRRAVR